MRTVDLGRTAAQAELLRLKRLIRRQINRVVWGAVAAVFGIAFLTMVHIVGYELLLLALSPLLSSVIVLAVDLVLLVVFAMFALRGAPDPVEAEARLVRDEALAEMKQSLAVTAIVSPLARMTVRRAGGRPIYGSILSGVIERFLTRPRR